MAGATAKAIANDFKSRIKFGEFKSGDRLPSESLVAKEWNVGRTTIREAYVYLDAWGLIASEQGRGSYVR